MKIILILTVITTLNSCLKKDKELLEPSPKAIESLTESSNNKQQFDYSGVLSLSQIKIPILHSRDTIAIHLYPTRSVVAKWRYLEEKKLTQKLLGNNRYESCLVKYYTFEKFNHEEPIVENLNSNHIILKLNGTKLTLNKDYKWNVESDHFEIIINNPHLKGAELNIINNTVRNLHYKWLDTRNCVDTKHLKNTKVFEEYKLEVPEHFVFDYSIY